MDNSDMDKLLTAEFKEAFDEFDTVVNKFENCDTYQVFRMAVARYPPRSYLAL